MKILWRVAGVAATLSALAITATANTLRAGRMADVTGIVRAAENPGSDCAARLTEFVEALDRVLDSNPSSAGPISALLQTRFPMERCDIEQSFKISRQSKFFLSVSSHTGYYTFQFNNGGFFDSIGFSVSFGLSKQSGDSFLPSVGPNKQWMAPRR